MMTAKSAHGWTLSKAAPTGIPADGPPPTQNIQEADFRKVHMTLLLFFPNQCSCTCLEGDNQGLWLKKNYTTKKLFSFQISYQVH